VGTIFQPSLVKKRRYYISWAYFIKLFYTMAVQTMTLLLKKRPHCP